MTDPIYIKIGAMHTRNPKSAGGDGWKHAKFECSGPNISGLYRDPEHDIPRKLLAQKISPTCTIVFQHGKRISEPQEIGELARWTMRDDDKGLRRVKFKEFPNATD